MHSAYSLNSKNTTILPITMPLKLQIENSRSSIPFFSHLFFLDVQALNVYEPTSKQILTDKHKIKVAL